MNDVYAHSLEGSSVEHWQTLSAHLESVAELAHIFGQAFNSGNWASIIGMAHDLGKARQSFQHYLRISNGLTDADYDASEHSHSGSGAIWAMQAYPKHKLGRIFAYAIAGHHAGLPDWVGGITPGGSLSYRLEQENDVVQENAVTAWIRSNSFFSTPSAPFAPPWRFENADVSFWIRMLYSCLVDADFLDTEGFMAQNAARARSQYPELLEHSITRMAVATEKEAEAQGGDNRTMGRKNTVPYGVYVAYGFISPALAAQTGFGEEDLVILWKALTDMFEHDHSAARGMMATQKLVVFKHDTALGNAHSHTLFKAVKLATKDGVEVPRDFSDYTISIPAANAFPGVEVIVK